jgi:hypothetical protein
MGITPPQYYQKKIQDKMLEEAEKIIAKADEELKEEINKAVIYNDEFSRKQLNKKAIKLLEEIKGNQNEN